MKLTALAKKHWEKVPREFRMKILNNVFCVECLGSTGIAEINGTVRSGDLLLRGICTKCGHTVARVIETSEIQDPV